MKQKYLFCLLFLLPFSTFAQPQGINYQGVARDSMGHPILNQIISLRLSILDSSSTGQAVYTETHNVVTNSAGIFNVSIGMGTVVAGVFASISWGTGNKWLKVELDSAGGSIYQLIGTIQFLSVPYSMYSGKANSLDNNQSTPDNMKTLIYLNEGF